MLKTTPWDTGAQNAANLPLISLDPSDLAMAPFAYNRDHAGCMQSSIFGYQSFGAIPSYQPVGADTQQSDALRKQKKTNAAYAAFRSSEGSLFT